MGIMSYDEFDCLDGRSADIFLNLLQEGSAPGRRLSHVPCPRASKKGIDTEKAPRKIFLVGATVKAF
jgi:hypothetical protein